MTGNHEMLYEDKSSGLEFSNPGADQVWTQWLTASGFGAKAGNGPTSAAPNADALQDDQSKLTYSFDATGVRRDQPRADRGRRSGARRHAEGQGVPRSARARVPVPELTIAP